MKSLTKKCQTDITPAMALDLLQKGNERFVSNLKVNRNLLQQINETSEGQHPFAVIISCMDSRTSAELIFDQGLGDIFSVRVAGNVINEDIIGSAEFGCKVVGAKIIVVLGHTGCGAITGTLNHVELGKFSSITSKIQRCLPSIQNRLNSKDDLAHALTIANVKQGMNDLLEGSSILSEMLKNEEISLVGGLYDVATGQVNFSPELMDL